MIGPILCLLTPLVVALIAAAFYKRPAEYLARLMVKHGATHRIVAILLLSFGFVGAYCMDRLDISDLLFEDATVARADLDLLQKDLTKVHGLTDAHAASITGRIDGIVKTLKEPQSNAQIYFLSCIVGICGGVYLLLSVYHTASDGVVNDWLTECKKKEIEATNFWSVCRQIEYIVVSKWQRIEEILKLTPLPKNTSERLKLCRSALDPSEQTYCFVQCVHRFFSSYCSRPETRGSRLVVSLYLPQNDFLTVVASTDGNLPGVVTGPNGEFRDFFDLRTPLPQSAAVKCFKAKAPKIFPDTAKDPDFVFFDETQKLHLKSAFACPLFYSTGQIIGVIFAEADVINYFENTEQFRLMLSEIGQQIALRHSLESCVNGLLKRLEESIEQETK